MLKLDTIVRKKKNKNRLPVEFAVKELWERAARQNWILFKRELQQDKDPCRYNYGDINAYSLWLHCQMSAAAILWLEQGLKLCDLVAFIIIWNSAIPILLYSLNLGF